MNDSERKKTIRYIVIFSVLVIAVAWTGPLLGGDPTSQGLGFLIWGTAPILVSLLMRAVTRDWSDLGIKPGFRKNFRWYLVSLLAYPVGNCARIIDRFYDFGLFSFRILDGIIYSGRPASDTDLLLFRAL
jgi:hypothetical protein